MSEIVPTAEPRQTYGVLESWRGICACMVVLWHVPAVSVLHGTWLIKGSYLFTDFFFVLSGFIIFENYYDRIRGGFSLVRFMALRFGRLYPLHVFVLLLFMMWELGVVLDESGASRTAFGEPNTPYGLFLNLTFLNAMGLDTRNTWNFPAWSIGAEFYTYLVFALLIRFAGAAILPLLAAVSVGSVALLLTTDYVNMDMTYDYGMLRCMAGFGVGAICQRLRHRFGLAMERGAAQTTLAELAVLALVFGFVALAGSNRGAFAAPFVFSLVILVFAAEGGRLSALLNTTPFRFVGQVSYSIYLLHLFILILMPNMVKGFGQSISMTLTTTVPVDGDFIVLLGANEWQGTAAHILVLVPIVIVAAAVYRMVEMPTRLASRRIAARIGAPAGPADASPA